MAEGLVKFKNDRGLAEIAIGVNEFKCIGAAPPEDHPHIYQKIGPEGFVHCLYCNTKFVFRPELAPTETIPPGNFFEDEAAEKVEAPLAALL